MVLAVPASLANADTTGPHNWIDALAKLQLSAAAPGEYAPAALAFTAVWQMFANLPGGEQAVSEPFFEIVRAQVPVAASFERSSNTSTARAFPTTEQQIRAWNTAHTAAPISAMTPNEGAPLIGMGPDSDAAALGRIAKQVHGITASARNPEDLLTAFASAVWTVGTTGNYDVKTD